MHGEDGVHLEVLTLDRLLASGEILFAVEIPTGFERELRSRILAVTSHATIMGLDGSLTDWRSTSRAAPQLPLGRRWAGTA